MIPPVDQAVLNANPKFAALHKTLTTSLLNPDGSTKSSRSQKQRVALREPLLQARTQSTKRLLLLNALITSPLPSSLPTPSHELIHILTSLLSSPAPPPSQTLSLLLPSSSLLTSSLPPIATHLSTHLHAHALALARLLSPSTNRSFLHKKIAALPSLLDTLQRTLEDAHTDLQTRRLALAPLTATVLRTHRENLEMLIAHLERVAHGTYARHVRAEAALLAAEAGEARQEAEMVYVRVREGVYSGEVRAALRNYGEHLRDAESRLRARERDARGELARYGVGRRGGEEVEGRVGKEKVMREVARVYGEMRREVDEVRRDVERLRRS